MQIKCLFASLLLVLYPITANAQNLPDGFVYLRQIDPTIIQDIRYHARNNFIGAPLVGYNAPECILKREAAEALKSVQSQLAQNRYSLYVFDCYRPQKAVTQMNDWAKSGAGFNARYYPKTTRDTLVKEGYIAEKSGHSTGYTIDLAIAPNRRPLLVWPRKSACWRRTDYKTLDFGTPFDCFDKMANTANANISQKAKQNRQLILDIMQNAGFNNYPDEWWHFTHKSRPTDAEIYDFDITKP